MSAEFQHKPETKIITLVDRLVERAIRESSKGAGELMEPNLYKDFCEKQFGEMKKILPDTIDILNDKTSKGEFRNYFDEGIDVFARDSIERKLDAFGVPEMYQPDPQDPKRQPLLSRLVALMTAEVLAQLRGGSVHQKFS